MGKGRLSHGGSLQPKLAFRGSYSTTTSVLRLTSSDHNSDPATEHFPCRDAKLASKRLNHSSSSRHGWNCVFLKFGTLSDVRLLHLALRPPIQTSTSPPAVRCARTTSAKIHSSGTTASDSASVATYKHAPPNIWCLTSNWSEFDSHPAKS